MTPPPKKIGFDDVWSFFKLLALFHILSKLKSILISVHSVQFAPYLLGLPTNRLFWQDCPLISWKSPTFNRRRNKIWQNDLFWSLWNKMPSLPKWQHCCDKFFCWYPLTCFNISWGINMKNMFTEVTLIYLQNTHFINFVRNMPPILLAFAPYLPLFSKNDSFCAPYFPLLPPHG